MLWLAVSVALRWVIKEKQNNLMYFFVICLFTVLWYSKVFNQGAPPPGPPPCRGPLPRASESSRVHRLVNPTNVETDIAFNRIVSATHRGMLVHQLVSPSAR